MKNVVSIKDNELLNNLIYSSYYTVSMKEMITANILEDYSNGDYNNGIKFCDLKVFPSDLYWENNQRAKNWANGDILNIGDIIIILDKNSF